MSQAPSLPCWDPGDLVYKLKKLGGTAHSRDAFCTSAVTLEAPGCLGTDPNSGIPGRGSSLGVLCLEPKKWYHLQPLNVTRNLRGLLGSLLSCRVVALS